MTTIASNKNDRQVQAGYIFDSLKDLVDTRVNHEHYEHDSSIGHAVKDLYINALIAGRDTDKSPNPKKRILENKFYDGVRYLLRYHCPLEQIKIWMDDGFSTHHKDTDSNIDEMIHVYNNPIGRREKIVARFLNNFGVQINEYKSHSPVLMRPALDFCSAVIGQAYSTIAPTCPSIIRSCRMKKVLDRLQDDVDCKHRRKKFSKIPQ